jgi:hypothetical protein
VCRCATWQEDLSQLAQTMPLSEPVRLGNALRRRKTRTRNYPPHGWVHTATLPLVAFEPLDGARGVRGLDAHGGGPRGVRRCTGIQ